MVKLIVAIGPNGLIGKGNKIPWHISNEFKHFKDTTMGHTLFMGGNTLNGLPSVLPGRKIIAFSFVEESKADKTITSMDEAKEFLMKNKDTKELIFIAGGKFVYENFQEFADELIISHVKTEKKGDVFLELHLNNYKKTLLKEDSDFTTYSYRKN